MKRLFLGAFALILSIAANATTFTPIQLLNPAGSTSGQVIVSSGPSTVPAWGGIGLNGIAAIAANTVLANVTSGSANPAAFSMPSCSTSASILQYTSNTGFTCSTTIWASPPAIGATTPGSGKFTTLQATSTITPSSTAGIAGTTLADNANSGSVGEYPNASVPLGVAVSLTTSVTANVTSLTLPAGDWKCGGTASFNISVGAGSLQAGISTTSATMPLVQSNGTLSSMSLASGNFGSSSIAIYPGRFNVSTSTTVYLVANAVFGSGTVGAYGFIGCVRSR